MRKEPAVSHTVKMYVEIATLPLQSYVAGQTGSPAVSARHCESYKAISVSVGKLQGLIREA